MLDKLTGTTANPLSINSGTLRSLNQLGFSDENKFHAPKVPTIPDLFKHFGGLNLEEESDISDDEDDNQNENLSLSEDQGLSETSDVSRDSDMVAENENGMFKTYFVLFKGFIAIGAVYLPYNCSQSGWITTILVLFIVSCLVLCGMSKLLQCKTATGKSYSNVTKKVCGKTGMIVVDCILFIGQVLFFVHYLL